VKSSSPEEVVSTPSELEPEEEKPTPDEEKRDRSSKVDDDNDEKHKTPRKVTVTTETHRTGIEPAVNPYYESVDSPKNEGNSLSRGDSNGSGATLPIPEIVLEDDDNAIDEQHEIEIPTIEAPSIPEPIIITNPVDIPSGPPEPTPEPVVSVLTSAPLIAQVPEVSNAVVDTVVKAINTSKAPNTVERVTIPVGTTTSGVIGGSGQGYVDQKTYNIEVSKSKKDTKISKKNAKAMRKNGKLLVLELANAIHDATTSGDAMDAINYIVDAVTSIPGQVDSTVSNVISSVRSGDMERIVDTLVNEAYDWSLGPTVVNNLENAYNDLLGQSKPTSQNTWNKEIHGGLSSSVSGSFKALNKATSKGSQPTALSQWSLLEDASEQVTTQALNVVKDQVKLASKMSNPIDRLVNGVSTLLSMFG
jgi:hypothetical protein